MNMNDSPSTPIPTEAGFDGYAAEWYYWDSAKRTLTQEPRSNAMYATGDTPKLSLRPRYLNAPDAAVGSNDKTQFKDRGKPTAYIKVQVVQDKATGSATKPLTWAALYPVIDNPNDDITSHTFEDPVSGDPVDNVPIPGGTARIF